MMSKESKLPLCAEILKRKQVTEKQNLIYVW